MAYVIPSGAIAELLFKGTHFGQTVMTTHHYRWDGPLIADGADFMANILGASTIATLLFPGWRDALSQDVTNMELSGQWIYPLRYRKVTATPIPAHGTQDVAPATNIAQVVTLLSEESGRHGIGNKHLPGLALTGYSDGKLNPSQIVLLNSYGDAMRTPVPAPGGVLTPIIYDRANPTVSRTGVFYDINPNVRVERRRTVGLGK